MFQRMSQSTESVIGYEIQSKLSAEEVRQLAGELEGAIEKTGKIRVLIDLRAFPYAGAGAMWEDLKFDIKHARDIEKAAVIGDRASEKWGTRIFGAITPTKTRYFERSDGQEAWSWLIES